MAGKTFFIDTTRCTACRGCQIACKNWNRNGASITKNTGSHQNPPDLDANTFKLVRFSEVVTDGKLAWYFFADQCRHCLLLPACVKICPTGTMNFGERDAMMKLAKERLTAVKAKYPKAQLLDADQVRTVFLVVDDPAKYHEKAVASASPPTARRLAARPVSKPVAGLLRVLRLG
jgi:Fe-S-cluster-containing dehydrogenase component